MLFAIILLVLLVFFFILFQVTLKGFKNPQRKHTKTPKSIGLEFEEINISTANNCNLYGWLMVKNPASSTIILVHGWGRNVERMMPYIKPLNKTDFNLLAFDARHHGNSDEDDHSNMKKFAEDIIASINFIVNKTRISNPDFGVVGLSIGGAASIYVAAHDERIKSVITVGALANPYNIMREQLASRHIPYIPFGWFLFWYLEKKVGFSFKEIAPENHIHKSDAKFLLIHGTDDVTIPVDHLYRLKNAGKSEYVSISEIPGRGHSDCHYEVGYWEKISRFLEQTLN